MCRVRGRENDVARVPRRGARVHGLASARAHGARAHGLAGAAPATRGVWKAHAAAMRNVRGGARSADRLHASRARPTRDRYLAAVATPRDRRARHETRAYRRRARPRHAAKEKSRKGAHTEHEQLSGHVMRQRQVRGVATCHVHVRPAPRSALHPSSRLRVQDQLRRRPATGRRTPSRHAVPVRARERERCAKRLVLESEEAVDLHAGAQPSVHELHPRRPLAP